MGSQFTSFGFENLLNRHKIDHSYSTLGHPYDNAKIESFHSLLKRDKYCNLILKCVARSQFFLS
ncbi:transposase family protein [Leuconostoc gelidum subsp. gasicomitatum]|nr:transposase family protein [Leuconostoc gasicomitatum]MBZ5955637.1 transposase family protein [Leuconostoc gasicomitatum]MBZ5956766.1 transposase family protein [Leuconostoc gasicomitatum]MBZ5960745.1 transposase family protein [Leuconostoc gasicomitatum]MBZ5993332.1 transposase family protein [Leuconostoc gasicomitatum]